MSVSTVVSAMANPFKQLIDKIAGTTLAAKSRQRSWLGRNLCASSKLISTTDGLHTLTRAAIAAGQIYNPTRFLQTPLPILVQFHLGFKSINIVPSLNYLIGCGAACAAKAGDYATITSRALLALSDAAATLNFAHFLDVINTNHLAQKIGNLSVLGLRPFQFMNTLAIGRFILGTSCVAFVITSAQLTQIILKGDKSSNTLISAVSVIAEVSVRLFLLFATTLAVTTQGIVITGILGGLAANTATYLAYKKAEST